MDQASNQKEFWYYDMTAHDGRHMPELVAGMRLANGKAAIVREGVDRGLIEIVDSRSLRDLAKAYAELAQQLEMGFIRENAGREL